MATKLLKKLTLRDIVGGKPEILKIAQTGQIEVEKDGKKVILPQGNVVPLCMILGQVVGFKPGESDNGPYLKLKGTFEATNLQTGEVLPHAGDCILPNFVADAIGVALQAGAQSVDFGVKINVQYDEDAATMYVYSAESLLKPVEAQPITGLKAMFAAQGIELPKPANAPALPAPTPAAAPAPAPAPVAAEPASKGKTKK